MNLFKTDAPRSPPLCRRASPGSTSLMHQGSGAGPTRDRQPPRRCRRDSI